MQDLAVSNSTEEEIVLDNWHAAGHFRRVATALGIAGLLAGGLLVILSLGATRASARPSNARTAHKKASKPSRPAADQEGHNQGLGRLLLPEDADREG